MFIVVEPHYLWRLHSTTSMQSGLMNDDVQSYRLAAKEKRFSPYAMHGGYIIEMIELLRMIKPIK